MNDLIRELKELSNEEKIEAYIHCKNELKKYNSGRPLSLCVIIDNYIVEKYKITFSEAVSIRKLIFPDFLKDAPSPNKGWLKLYCWEEKDLYSRLEFCDKRIKELENE